MVPIPRMPTEGECERLLQQYKEKVEGYYRQMCQIWNDGQSGDIKIVCDRGSFWVHSDIIIAESDHFKAVLNPGHGFQEAIQRVIKLPHEDLLDMKALMHAMYAPERDDLCLHHAQRDVTDPGDAFQLAVRLHGLADRYHAPRIQELAVDTIWALAGTQWTAGVRAALPAAVTHAYEQQHEHNASIHDQLVDMAADKIADLEGDAAFREAARACEGFGDALEGTVTVMRWEGLTRNASSLYRCPACADLFMACGPVPNFCPRCGAPNDGRFERIEFQYKLPRD